MEGLAARMDRLLFVKRGYSLYQHLVPFAIASLLLLLLLSLRPDDLLVRLVEVLQKPTWLRLPAALLTVVSALVYVAALRLQVAKAYLEAGGLGRRTAATAALYVLLCSLLAYGVLQTRSSALPLAPGTVWACCLLALLSLTGLGWQGPGSWLESLGVEVPDYTDAHRAARELRRLLGQLRRKAVGEPHDVAAFSKLATRLHQSIETNLPLEPRWARDAPRRAQEEAERLVEETGRAFPESNAAAVQDFATAVALQREHQYPKFTAQLRQVEGLIAKMGGT